MAPRSKAAGKRKVVHDEECGSGQSAESFERDRAVQEELLIAAAANVGQGTSSDARTTTSKKLRQAAHGAGIEKKRKPKLSELPGFADLKDSGNGGGGGGGGSSRGKKQRPIVAKITLARYMQGPKKGQLSGKAFFCINPVFEENKAYQWLVKRLNHDDAKWFKDWATWAVPCPTPELALRIFGAIKTDRDLKGTAANMNKVLDVTPYDDPAIKKPEFTLATSELEFETKDGLLPRSTMIIGATYAFKEFLKERWSEVQYTDLVIGEDTKAAWVLPTSAETEETGTLADFLRELGVSVTEVDLDEGDDEEDDDERNGNEFVDDEAEEATDLDEHD